MMVKIHHRIQCHVTIVEKVDISNLNAQEVKEFMTTDTTIKESKVQDPPTPKAKLEGDFTDNRTRVDTHLKCHMWLEGDTPRQQKEPPHSEAKFMALAVEVFRKAMEVLQQHRQGQLH